MEGYIAKLIFLLSTEGRQRKDQRKDQETSQEKDGSPGTFLVFSLCVVFFKVLDEVE